MLFLIENKILLFIKYRIFYYHSVKKSHVAKHVPEKMDILCPKNFFWRKTEGARAPSCPRVVAPMFRRVSGKLEYFGAILKIFRGFGTIWKSFGEFWSVLREFCGSWSNLAILVKFYGSFSPWFQGLVLFISFISTHLAYLKITKFQAKT